MLKLIKSLLLNLVSANTRYTKLAVKTLISNFMKSDSEIS